MKTIWVLPLIIGLASPAFADSYDFCKNLDEAIQKSKPFDKIQKEIKRCKNFEYVRSLTDHDNWTGTVLETAACAGNVQAVQALLAAGAKVDGRDGSGQTALMTAAHCGSIPVVQALLAAGAEVNYTDPGGRSAFAHAHTPEMRNLLGGSGAALPTDWTTVTPEVLHDYALKNAAKTASDGWALRRAASYGWLDVAQALVAAGADVNQGRDQGTPLALAAQGGEIGLARYLLAHGADANAADWEGITPLIKAAQWRMYARADGKPQLTQEDSAAMTRLLLENGAKVDAVDDRGFTPLLSAAGQDNLAAARVLLEKGARVNAVVTPAPEEARREREEKMSAARIAAFLNSSAAVSVQDYKQVERLASSAKANGIIGTGKHAAKARRGISTHGAGYTALLLAAGWGDAAMTRLLIDHGADPRAVDGDGLTAADVARQRNHADVAAIIEGGPSVAREEEAPAPSGRKRKSAAPTEQAGISREEMRQMAADAATAAANAAANAATAVANARQAAPAPAAPPALTREDMERIADDAARKAAAQNQASPAAKPAEPSVKSDVDSPLYSESQHPHDVALVVGVEKYNDLPSASFAERDAKAVRTHLIALGYPPRNVVLLAGASASRAGLAKNLEKRLPDLVKEDSTVFFYFSGHGSADPATGKAYLLPADGDAQYLEETAYPLARVYERLGALKARRVIVALDSCFSGAGGRSVIPKGTRPLINVVTPKAAEISAKIVSLTASTSKQISGVIEEQGHGAFTYYLLKGLSDGKRSTRQLYDFLEPQVEDAARSENRDQSPTMTGADAPVN